VRPCPNSRRVTAASLGSELRGRAFFHPSCSPFSDSPAPACKPSYGRHLEALPQPVRKSSRARWRPPSPAR